MEWACRSPAGAARDQLLPEVDVGGDRPALELPPG